MKISLKFDIEHYVSIGKPVYSTASLAVRKSSKYMQAICNAGTELIGCSVLAVLLEPAEDGCVPCGEMRVGVNNYVPFYERRVCVVRARSAASRYGLVYLPCSWGCKKVVLFVTSAPDADELPHV